MSLTSLYPKTSKIKKLDYCVKVLRYLINKGLARIVLNDPNFLKNPDNSSTVLTSRSSQRGLIIPRERGHQLSPISKEYS